MTQKTTHKKKRNTAGVCRDVPWRDWKISTLWRILKVRKAVTDWQWKNTETSEVENDWRIREYSINEPHGMRRPAGADEFWSKNRGAKNVEEKKSTHHTTNTTTPHAAPHTTTSRAMHHSNHSTVEVWTLNRRNPKSSENNYNSNTRPIRKPRFTRTAWSSMYLSASFMCLF